MYPASFDYVVPATLEEALDTLGRYEDDAKVLAGGMSLIPLMKLRLAAPRALVDINRLPGLDTLAAGDGGLRIGALVRTRACERSDLLGGDRWGTLGAAAPLISDPIIRNLGTVCGSLAHADPQGDWGSALMAMGAEVVARGPDGTRTIPLEELFEGPFVTSLAPTEIITEVRVPDPGPNAAGTYLKLERKVGDFATVGVAVHLSMDDGKVGRAGIALTAVGPTNLRAAAAEEALAGAEPTDAAIREAARLAAEAARPYSDTRGTADYKRNVVRVFTERGLRAAADALGHPVPGRSAAGSAPRTTGEALEATDRQDYFSGEETVAGVMEELEEKPGGPDGGAR
jgi:aerobic carbon-monoxide dehydrogenase medium subunit